MKKKNLLILIGGVMLAASCAVTTNNAYTTAKTPISSQDNSIPTFTVTFDFNGGKYYNKEKEIVDDVKQTTYFHYVKEKFNFDPRLVIPPDHYEFIGFSLVHDDKENLISDDYVVEKDITAFAQYKLKDDDHCEVRWLDDDKTKIDSETYFLGETPEFKGTLPFHPGYEFDGWDPTITAIAEEDCEKGFKEYTAKYVKIFRVHEVELDYNDGSTSEIHIQKVPEGECVIEPKITKKDYTFDKWIYVKGGEGEFDFSKPITTDGIKIEALWTQKAYTVTWLNYNGDKLYSSEVVEGKMPEYEGENPTRESDPFTDYEFKGWVPQLSKVTSNQIYIANFEETHYNAQVYMQIDVTEEQKTFSFNCDVVEGAPQVSVDWGDGNNSNIVGNGNSSHTYTNAGKYNVRITGYVLDIQSTEESKLLLNKLYLGTTVTSISNSAFKGCSNLVSVDITKNVVSIGASAFQDCSGLLSIKIPNSITSIGASAFDNCSALAAVTFQENSTLATIGDSAFHNCPILVSIDIPSSVTSIGASAFKDCIKLKEITFQTNSKLKTIGASAFYNCASLTSINILASVTSIGESVFEGCTVLEEATFQDNSALTTISDSSFKGCSNLHSIRIPNKVTSISDSAFMGCKALEELTFQDNSVLTTINGYAFKDCSSLVSVNIPSSVTSIGSSDEIYSFANCTQLTTVTFQKDSQLEWIGCSVFEECTNLESISIPSKVTTIDDFAFHECINLSKVEFVENSSLNRIGHCAFKGCSSLVSINIPSSVTTLDNSVFCECSKLEQVTFQEGSQLTMIGYQAFKDSVITAFDVPNKVTEIGGSAFLNCNKLKSITFQEGSSLKKIGDSSFENCSSLTSITIPDGVTEIGANAFKDCTNLKSITIPNTVTKIGANAFKDCFNIESVNISSLSFVAEGIFSGCSSLASITIPDGVTEIGANAFNGCSSLETITVPNSVTSIGENAFDGCPPAAFNEYDSTLYLGNESNKYVALIAPKSVDLPTGIEVNSACKVIANDAFYGRNISSIKIPLSIKYIGGNAFRDCHYLKNIYIDQFTEESQIPTLGNSYVFTDIDDNARFWVASEAMRDIFIDKGHGWPTDREKYDWQRNGSLSK